MLENECWCSCIEAFGALLLSLPLPTWTNQMQKREDDMKKKLFFGVSFAPRNIRVTCSAQILATASIIRSKVIKSFDPSSEPRC